MGKKKGTVASLVSHILIKFHSDVTADLLVQVIFFFFFLEHIWGISFPLLCVSGMLNGISGSAVSFRPTVVSDNVVGQAAQTAAATFHRWPQ